MSAHLSSHGMMDVYYYHPLSPATSQVRTLFIWHLSGVMEGGYLAPGRTDWLNHGRLHASISFTVLRYILD